MFYVKIIFFSYFITSTITLQCYTCTISSSSNCSQIEECQRIKDRCFLSVSKLLISSQTHIAVSKGCALPNECNNQLDSTIGTIQVTNELICCDTDLCNGDDTIKSTIRIKPTTTFKPIIKSTIPNIKFTSTVGLEPQITFEPTVGLDFQPTVGLITFKPTVGLDFQPTVGLITFKPTIGLDSQSTIGPTGLDSQSTIGPTGLDSQSTIGPTGLDFQSTIGPTGLETTTVGLDFQPTIGPITFKPTIGPITFKPTVDLDSQSTIGPITFKPTDFEPTFGTIPEDDEEYCTYINLWGCEDETCDNDESCNICEDD